MKKLCCLMLAAALMLTIGACGKKNSEPEFVYVDEGTQETESGARRDTAILFTAGTAQRDVRFFAALEALREQYTYKYLQGYVGLVDLGGALDVRSGEQELYNRLCVMNYMNYEAGAFAAADLADGIGTAVRASNEAQFPLLCGNLTITGSDSAAMSAWTLASYGALRVAFVSALVSEDVDAALLTDEETVYELTDAAEAIGTAASAARRAGADFVIAIVSCGEATAEALAAQISGVDALLDGAGDGGESRSLTDAQGATLLYSGLDPSQESVGLLVIGEDDSLSAQVITELESQSAIMLDYLAGFGYDVEEETTASSDETTSE